MIATIHALLVLFASCAYTEFQIVSGPGENSTLVCNETWVAWENNTSPFYAQYVQSMTFYDVEINGTLANITLQRDVIQVLEGSMPIIPIAYLEEGENGTTGRPVICRNPPTSQSEDDTALVIVIYVTSSLGIIASIVALVTYMLLPTLRTLPGLVIMNLFLAFLLGDIMLQIRIGFEYHGMRYLVNYALWQGLLVARFAWMSLTGIEMCSSLYRGVRLIGNSHSYRKWVTLTIYMLIGWGTSIALAIIMFVVELKAESSTVKRLFGGVGYLTNLLPITVSQLINISALVFISVILFNAARRQRKMNQYRYTKKNINFVRLFLVLLTVLGLVWIMFFVLVSIPDADAQRLGVVITYVILTDTQPIFVCIAFICTPKVYRMYLVRFHIRTEDDLCRKNRRTGTIASACSQLQPERCITSQATHRVFKNLPPLKRVSPPLHTIAEETEESSNNTVNNGTVGNGSTAVATIQARNRITEEERRAEQADSLTREETDGLTERDPESHEVYSTENLAVTASSNTLPVNHNPSKSSLTTSSINPDRENTHT